MLSYLEKYKQLDQGLKDNISTPEIKKTILELGQKYYINLAIVIMKIMVKEISLIDLHKYFVLEHGLEKRKADELVTELKNKVFYNVSEYLGFIPDKMPEPEPERGYLEDKDTEVRSSNFFFSTEDEEEVAELTKKLEDFGEKRKEKKVEDERVIADKTNMAVKEANLNFSKDDLNTRFSNIINTYIRGVRNKVDTKQTLLKKIEEGGIGLNNALADRALKIADKYKTMDISTLAKGQPAITPPQKAPKAPVSSINNPENTLQKATANVKNIMTDNKAEASVEPVDEETKQKIGGRDVPYDFGALKQVKETEELLNEIMPDEPQSASLDEVNKRVNPVVEQPSQTVEQPNMPSQVQTQQAPVQAPANIAPAQDTININVQEVKSPPQAQLETAEIEEMNIGEPQEVQQVPMVEHPKIIASDTSTNKVKMEDVKYVPKLIGPVEELRTMQIANFRRLGIDPEESAEKIKEKITTLGKSNYADRLSGIFAWRQSMVNKAYLNIGLESLELNQPIDKVITQKGNGDDILTKREFFAIMDLNNELRF